MTRTTDTGDGYEPAIETVEMVCERLGEAGMPIGPDTARELIRAVLELEGSRVDARLRDGLETSLNTIRIAAQSALGALAAAGTGERPEEPAAPAERPVSRDPSAVGGRSGRRPAVKRKTGETPQISAPPAATRPEPQSRSPREQFDEGERRPVFRRPRR